MTVLKNGNTGIGTSSPAALLHTQGDGTGEGNVLFEGTYKLSNPGSPPASGGGTRMMWYPDKAAFRAGRVTSYYWNQDSIGGYSVAFGNDNRAIGLYSAAWGNNNRAGGQYSAAWGWNNQANASCATAWGKLNVVSESFATAWGQESTASGFISTAFGDSTNASGSVSTALGKNTIASGSYSFVNGKSNTAPSYAETVIGQYNQSYSPSGPSSWQNTDRVFSIGIGTSSSARANAMTVLKNGNTGIGTTSPDALLHTYGAGTSGGNVLFEGYFKSMNPGNPPASGTGTRMMWYPDKAAFRVGYVSGTLWDKNSVGNYSFAAGESTTASGSAAIALGKSATASGSNAVALGYGSTASNTVSTALGYGATASGIYAVAMGEESTASGKSALACNRFTTAPSYAETVIGQYNETYSPSGTTSFQPADRLFVIGNGTSAGARSNAMTVLKNGNIGIGTSSPGNNRLYVTYNAAYPAAFIENTHSGGIGMKVENNSTDGTLLVSQKNTGYSLRCDSWNPSWHVAFIVKGDNVGIGTSTPSYQLQLSTNSAAKPTSSSWTISSDIRLKDVSGTYDKGLAELLQLQPIVFRYKEDNPLGILETKTDAYGFSAQEVQKVFPEAVGEKDGYLNLDMHPLLVAQVNAIRELNDKISEQQRLIEQLAEEVMRLKGSGTNK